MKLESWKKEEKTMIRGRSCEGDLDCFPIRPEGPPRPLSEAGTARLPGISGHSLLFLKQIHFNALDRNMY